MLSRHRHSLQAVMPSVLALLLACTPVAAMSAQTTDAAVNARDLELQYRRGDQALALQRLEAALAARPGDSGLRFLKAVLLGETGRTADAVQMLERMAEDFPDLPEPHNNLAVVHASAGRLERAREALEVALRLDPGYRTAHENLGDVLVRLAQRAYESAAAGGHAEPNLQTKLRLVRDLTTRR